MIKKNKTLRVLALSPHTDDIEFGCGGTISKLVAQGHDIYVAAFSDCKNSLHPDLKPNTLIEEATKSSKILKVKDLKILGYKVRYFSDNRQAILEDMVMMNKTIKPDLVFVPVSTDIHQDHQTIHNEAKRAFKQCNMLGYELPWNNIVITTNFFVRLEEKHIDTKTKAVMAFKSQAGRNYCNEKFIKSLAITRGTQIGCTYAEAFELIKWTDI
jgi:LmbE family N-acetylglucosaminyl deacetylase